MEKEPIIKINNIIKNFNVGVQSIQILRGITFEVYKGDFLIVFGPSGCGKSTLLHTILGLEPPSEGSIEFLGENLYLNKNEDARSIFRKLHIGMVYQQANWIRALNVVENVAFPLILMGVSRSEALSRSVAILKNVGMESKAGYTPTELSSGQQQRVSLARALINDPKVIVADEPTGNLDFSSGQEVMELLVALCKQWQKTIIMVTHDLEYLKYSTRIVKMFDGTVVGVFDESDKEKIIASIQTKRGQ